MREKYLR